MRQYELWWATLPEPAGHRPVLLVSREGAYRYLSRITVVEVTSRAFGIPQEVPLGRREGLARESVARCDNIASVPRRLLIRRMGRLSYDRVVEVKRALGHTLGWSELVRL
jgi:mRNA-degrading endonuclease toxin of MazEF toxin-antitoxin module